MSEGNFALQEYTGGKINLSTCLDFPLKEKNIPLERKCSDIIKEN